MSDYTIVRHSDADEVSKGVTELLGEGWVLYGSLTVSISTTTYGCRMVYAQAMTHE
jgi:hypothetical protein